ncbi:type I-E CRISPR-associated protein Cas5/CasD [Nonomuraea cavernae]|uniref:Type I-E CRISPR-associated protein Cas5/CasD n=1 Tax=Nonomuraea cavernae TaxID=2045107 RepID=A0A917ZEG7_9ACTN|nr:type I-E CRISPR-associated protein Cas5/CasD [Nonomuraea cavernae]MCA2190624.1 type I-E CRISPR-associated protein Cas5/CasD [Nonomuraea cavernae]GGO81323.1 type I-E CRISPR-associated protein Cas5/CasD [Nonomuraea cavernae]
MSGLILRLAGPLQSWGEHSAFAERDTQRFPTRSGLIGLFASAYGMRRGEDLSRFDDLRFTIRIDRPGIPMADFHTVGGGRVRQQTVPTSEGGRRSVETATIVTRRHYLADAVFIVGVTGPDDAISELADRLGRPRWQPYLGRRSCPPDPPFLLRRTEDTYKELTERVPVPCRFTGGQLDVVREDGDARAASVAELLDVPVSFAGLERRYRHRTVSITPCPIPERLWLGWGRLYQDALFAYAGGTP